MHTPHCHSIFACLIAALAPILATGATLELNDVGPTHSDGKISPEGLPSAYDGELLYYVANSSTDALLVASVNKTGGWNGATPVGYHSSVTTPAFVQVELAYMAFVGSDGENEVNIASSSDGINWSGRYVIPGVKSKFAPALAWVPSGAFQFQLVVAFVADDGTDDLYVIETTNLGVSSTASALKWGTPVKVVGQKSKTAPAMITFLYKDDYELVLAYVADNASNDLLITTSTDGIKWTPDMLVKGTQDETPQQTPLAPALTNYFVGDQSVSTLLLGYVANNGSNELFVTTSTDAIDWTKSSALQGHQTSTMPPALATSMQGSVIMAYVANNSGHALLVTISPDGIHWSANSIVGSQASKAAPALGTLFN